MSTDADAFIERWSASGATPHRTLVVGDEGSEHGGGAALRRALLGVGHGSSTDGAQKVNGSDLASEASYRDDSAENGTRYYYRVTAVDEAGNESDLSGSIEKTPLPDPPDEP